VAEQRGCSGTEAEAWVKEALQDGGRYHRDVW
jgi:sulfite reductase alpha subunit-like flavoprotein